MVHIVLWRIQVLGRKNLTASVCDTSLNMIRELLFLESEIRNHYTMII